MWKKASSATNSKMKNSINRHMVKKMFVLAIAVALLSACGGRKDTAGGEQPSKDSLSRPEKINVVAAIARVEPAAGFVELSADVSGIVVELYKKEGDTVKKGDVLFKLDNKAEDLQVTTARQEIAAQRARVAADKADIQQYEVSLREKEADLAVTERLAATGADTRENVRAKQKEREVILANLQSARARLETSTSELSKLQTQLAQTELTEKSRYVTAKESGLLVNMDAQLGSAITAYVPFGKLAPEGELVLHGEIDEMFAARVQTGMPVEVNYIGNSNRIATGTVIYVAPILENKSLFYESAGETSDRRVRLFKASFRSTEPLLINAKVECTIKMQ
jgi:multidrug efflux pump subunit AcrA (membrane-fusion protein)